MTTTGKTIFYYQENHHQILGKQYYNQQNNCLTRFVKLIYFLEYDVRPWKPRWRPDLQRRRQQHHRWQKERIWKEITNKFSNDDNPKQRHLTPLSDEENPTMTASEPLTTTALRGSYNNFNTSHPHLTHPTPGKHITPPHQIPGHATWLSLFLYHHLRWLISILFCACLMIDSLVVAS